MSPFPLQKVAAKSSSKTTLPQMLEFARALGRLAARLDEAEGTQSQVTPLPLTKSTPAAKGGPK